MKTNNNVMTQYIDKSALVAEIKERIETYNKGYANGDDKRADALDILLHDLNTLEVKEVDLTEVINFYIKSTLTGTNPIYTEGAVSCIIEKTAKYFFELGMAVRNKAQKGE